MAGRVVEIIPAKPMQVLKGLDIEAKLRVCAYCRVSTDNIEQLGSLDAQTQHYTRYIQQNPSWEYVGMFADEGISGTNTKKRTQFNRMIKACMDGKIDMIITKSVSRFARNTLDCLQYIRQLKERGVAVFFEKENVNTLDGRGEFMLTLLGSLAQEESNNLSKVTRMGIVYRFQAGKTKVNHNRFLGYTKDENGELIIDQEQAQIVRRIYKEYLLGYSALKISRGLTEEGIVNGAGNTKWWATNVTKILQNEKYIGDALLQKTYTVDFLNKKRAINNGEMQKYYVENNHPAIITKEDYTAVQSEFIRRSSMRGYSKTGKSAFTSVYAFSAKLFCVECRSKFRRSNYGRNGKKIPYWLCINHQTNGKKTCSMKSIRESVIEIAFVDAINIMIEDGDSFMKILLENIKIGISEVKQEESIEEIDTKLANLSNEMMGIVKIHAREGSQACDYNKEYKKLADRINTLRDKRMNIKNLAVKNSMLDERIKEITEFLQKTVSPLTEFNEELFRSLIDKMIVKSTEYINFIFKCGLEIKVEL